MAITATKYLLRKMIRFSQQIVDFARGERRTWVFGSPTADEKATLIKRLNFYGNRTQFVFTPFEDLNPLARLGIFLSGDPILTFGNPNQFSPLLRKIRGAFFDVDFRANPKDGWVWIDYMNYVQPVRLDFESVRLRFLNRLNQVRLEKYGRAYIFGTGPSLEQARDMDWSDGFRIVCNTIVRDEDLIKHLDPHWLAAGDAIYHFGFSEFAAAFRKDLKERMRKYNFGFVYPAQFHNIVLRELGEFSDRLFPIPVGLTKKVGKDLSQDFWLPALGNALALLLLPLGCTHSKEIYMWGFDGRAPDDKFFWSNSKLHSYPELMDELLKAHPAFYEFHVPKNDPQKYTRTVLGDDLEQAFLGAESSGYKFHMMHHSWTPALKKREVAQAAIKKAQTA